MVEWQNSLHSTGILRICRSGVDGVREFLRPTPLCRRGVNQIPKLKMPLENLKKIISEQSNEHMAQNSPNATGDQKTTAQPPRARVKGSPEEFGEKLERLRKEEPSIRPVVRAVRRLADCIKENASDKNAQVIDDAKNATHRVFDPGSRTMIEVPDHKTRLAAVTLELAYVEGTPVRREISVTGTFESFETVLERLKESPEARRMMKGMGMNLDVQKSPVEIEGEFTRETPAKE